MTNGLQGVTALVTGASSGIGFAVARAMADKGAWVGMVARDHGKLAAAAERAGGHAAAADISSPEAVRRLAEHLTERIGRAPDILVNAAGAFSLARFAETDPEDFDRQLETNLRGPFLMIRIFLPALLARRAGHIVNVGSVAGRIPLPGNAAYSASKYGLRGLHEVLAVEVRGTGVRTTLIEPAATDTPLWDPLDLDSRSDLPPRTAMLRPEDVARAVLFAIEQPPTVEVEGVSVRSTG